ncbi:siderophore-interacting protein [Gordonia defluvii]|jgi:NADPH-dependent ferric siderophore reductase|uniref:Siderophore-interacting protein n=1 Tax=Gordonia defluvii TaxID=283718 RepID=A0ABP6L0E1_9ACTN|nr:siderophore-interacting protein [Gordonia sp. UBA5067]
MTSMVAQVPSRGWQGAVLKLLRADDFLLTVAGVESITDHYVRVHFADGGLLARTALHPTMWIRLWFERDGRLHQRGYTVVDPDPATGTFFVEFAIHDGAAARWAQTTFVGDEIPATVMGSNYALPEPSPDGWLIVGDAAALPAVNSLLDAIEASESPDVPITIWMEYQHEDEFTLPLRVREHHRVEWLSRTGTGSTMVDAVRAAAFNATGYHAWVAAEAGSTRKVAGLFRQEFGLPRAAVTSRAYWAVGRPR